MTRKYITCPNCHENTAFRTSATDRVDLERDRGEYFPVACRHCLRPRTAHVNDVNAAPHPAITAAGGAAGVAAIAALWQLGFIAYAAGALPVIVYRAQVSAAATFNGYKLPISKR
ncbi:hypothetical protein [Lewinella sp. IMCC34183]|uniref:hypothetical protein n=1 Tax=Lewinella sp. IMCC34183 TaxID=2248762 RepID=UPI000E23C950|nr:hypothetical protein [Lewinella sp. IMCC34183]